MRPRIHQTVSLSFQNLHRHTHRIPAETFPDESYLTVYSAVADERRLLRGSKPTERAIISRMISEVPA